MAGGELSIPAAFDPLLGAQLGGYVIEGFLAIAVGKDKHPWGDDWQAPQKAENITGEESTLGKPDDPKGVIKGRQDDHPRTGPVGRYKPTRAGLLP